MVFGRRLAFVYDHFYPDSVGGAERYYWRLTRHLAASHAVSYLTRRPAGRGRQILEGVEVVSVSRSPSPGRPVPRRLGPKLTFALGLAWHLLRHGRRYDVVHCASFPLYALIAARVGLTGNRRTSLIADWHEVLPRETWRRQHGRRGEIRYRLHRGSARIGDAAVTFSRLHAERLRAFGRGEPLRVIPEFLADPPAPAPDDRPRQQVLLFVGRLVEEKRPELVIATLAELRRLDDSWRAELFGAGPAEVAVREAVAALDRPDSATLHGFAEWPVVAEAMTRSQALVLPTVREGFGLVVLEAAAHGLPSILVAAPDNAATELIEERVNGQVCARADPAELAQAVLMLCSDPGIHERTQAWYAQASRRYSVAAACEALGALHSELAVGVGAAGTGDGQAGR